MITDLKLQEVLSFEDIQHLFSMTSELTVTKHDGNGTLKINLQVTTNVDYDDDFNPKYTYANIDTLVYQPTLQTLIRDLVNLGWRQHKEVDSKSE